MHLLQVLKSSDVNLAASGGHSWHSKSLFDKIFSLLSKIIGRWQRLKFSLDALGVLICFIQKDGCEMSIPWFGDIISCWFWHGHFWTPHIVRWSWLYIRQGHQIVTQGRQLIPHQQIHGMLHYRRLRGDRIQRWLRIWQRFVHSCFISLLHFLLLFHGWHIEIKGVLKNNLISATFWRHRLFHIFMLSVRCRGQMAAVIQE